MSRERKTLLIIFGVVLVFGSAAIFLLADKKTALFWISYAAGVISVSASIFGSWLAIGDANQPSIHVFSTASYMYLIFTAVAIYLGYFKVYLPIKWYAAIHILLFAGYLVVMIAGYSGHFYITGQSQEIHQQRVELSINVERISQMGKAMNTLPEDIRTQAKEILYKVEEKLRYSDPMQSGSTAELAYAVEQALNELEQAVADILKNQGSLELLGQKAEYAVQKIDMCNNTKKLMK